MVAAMHEFKQPPPWLREVAEHELVAVDADTLAAYAHLPAEVHRRSYWIKVSSFEALRRAASSADVEVKAELGNNTTPLCVFLMPTTPLADAQRIFRLMTGETLEELHESLAAPADVGGEDDLMDVDQVVVCFHDLVDRECKMALFHAAQTALARIRAARELVADQTALVRILKARPGAIVAFNERGGFVSAADVPTPEKWAAADKMFVRREARWRQLVTHLTLLGYAPSPPTDAHGSADGASDGNAN